MIPLPTDSGTPSDYLGIRWEWNQRALHDLSYWCWDFHRQPSSRPMQKPSTPLQRRAEWPALTVLLLTRNNAEWLQTETDTRFRDLLLTKRTFSWVCSCLTLHYWTWLIISGLTEKKIGSNYPYIMRCSCSWEHEVGQQGDLKPARHSWMCSHCHCRKPLRLHAPRFMNTDSRSPVNEGQALTLVCSHHRRTGDSGSGTILFLWNRTLRVHNKHSR